MVGLLKIGFSTKDPEMRAQELDNTGCPHPYIVEYDVLVHDPYTLERLVHEHLRVHWEGKEWFRCSISEAIKVIRRVIGPGALNERVKTPVILNSPILNRFATAPPAPQHRKRNLKMTATYSCQCFHCGHPFSVTLTREDTNAICPSCFLQNDLTEFRRREFGIY